MGKKFGELTPEEAREIGRRGGIASGKAKREAKARRKEMKDTFETLLTMSIKKGRADTVEEIKAFAQIQGKNIRVNEALAVRVVQKALNGDLKAFEMIRDTIGEKPIENIHYADITPVVISGEDDIHE